MANTKNTGNNGGKGKPSTGKGSLPDITFLNISLSDAQKSAWKHWHSLKPNVSDVVAGILASEYKLSFGFDPRNNAVMCTLTDRKPESNYYNHCYTLRADAWETALSRVVWLHAVYADGDWGNLTDTSSVGDIW